MTEEDMAIMKGVHARMANNSPADIRMLENNDFWSALNDADIMAKMRRSMRIPNVDGALRKKRTLQFLGLMERFV